MNDELLLVETSLSAKFIVQIFHTHNHLTVWKQITNIR